MARLGSAVRCALKKNTTFEQIARRCQSQPGFDSRLRVHFKDSLGTPGSYGFRAKFCEPPQREGRLATVAPSLAEPDTAELEVIFAALPGYQPGVQWEWFGNTPGQAALLEGNLGF
jgi:hypothetical protein